MLIKKTEAKSLYTGRLTHGADLLNELTQICEQNSITFGRVEAIGAVKKAKIGYYNTDTFKYEYHELDQALEILNLTGNISLKDGKPMVHAHVTLADNQSRAFGGHLCPETIVFACEYVIEQFEGEPFSRGYDKETGLPLWPAE